MAKPPPEPPEGSAASAATAAPGASAALSVAEKIRQRLGELSPSERRVARTLLTGPPTIGLESSVRLAQHAGVSGPTVSRFIAELGFGSYAEFQRALHEEITARMMSPVEVYRRHQEGERSADVLGTSARTLGEAVTASVAGLDPEEFGRAVSLIADGGRQVLVTGGWFSQLLAGYLASVLRELRPGVRLVGPSASDRAGAIADIGRRDTVVAFDFRRYERDTLEIARAARAAGGRILLVTDPWLSPVADIADAVLTAQVSGPVAVREPDPGARRGRDAHHVRRRRAGRAGPRPVRAVRRDRRALGAALARRCRPGRPGDRPRGRGRSAAAGMSAGQAARQEAGHDPDREIQRGDRDALVHAVEHLVVVEVRRQQQRREPVSGDAEPGELLGVGAAAHAVRARPSRPGPRPAAPRSSRPPAGRPAVPRAGPPGAGTPSSRPARSARPARPRTRRRSRAAPGRPRTPSPRPGSR